MNKKLDNTITSTIHREPIWANLDQNHLILILINDSDPFRYDLVSSPIQFSLNFYARSVFHNSTEFNSMNAMDKAASSMEFKAYLTRKTQG